MDGTAAAIRTPDQRLRVFVSSTLRELAAERRAVRLAVERMGMAAVMFELGARPHPPRDLYRAYLQQSDVFVGLYWERYGWVAPGEDVSGLEDEYDLAPPSMPKLIYIKEAADGREPRLDRLLERIRNDDSVSFKYFSDADELGDVVGGDLAVLLAERFDRGRDAAIVQERPLTVAGSRLPAPLTELIGREDEVDRIVDMLNSEPVRLVSLVGPGGIGKTRLAIDVAARLDGRFPDGVTFVPLAPLEQSALVANAIAQAVGVPDTGEAPIEERLAVALRGQRRLLVLDNFEQLLDAAPMVPALLEAAPGLKVLVTTRALLRVAGEHAFEVGPLGLPTGQRSPRLPASVELFVERARAAKPDFQLDQHNIEAVERICVTLEGVPLALELAAARMRVLSPASVLERLDRQLKLLVGGRRDLPPRQQALRSTIEWSAKLLAPEERRLLAKLGVFSGRFSLEAAEFVAEGDEPDETLALLGALVDSSLLRQQERGGVTYFSMLATVREYALEQLEASGTARALRRRHAHHYHALAAESEPGLKGPQQSKRLLRLRDERDNLRAAARQLLDDRDWEAAADLAWLLFFYHWAVGQLGEGRSWMHEVLTSGEVLAARTRAKALFIRRAVDPGQAPDHTVPDLSEAADLFHREADRSGEALALVALSFAFGNPHQPDTARARDTALRGLALFREAGDIWGQSLALITLGRTELSERNATAALEAFSASLRLAESTGNEFGANVALSHVAEARILSGDMDGAEAAVLHALQVSMRMGFPDGQAYGLEGLMIVAGVRGEAEMAGILLGASEVRRERAGLDAADSLSVPLHLIDPVRTGAHADAFQSGYLQGRMLTVEEALDRFQSSRDAMHQGAARE